ncbi:hypothetical protein ACFLVD_00205 [Chloroflexota bacterium]
MTTVEPQEFNRQLVELRTVIIDGIACFSAWRGLMVEDEASAHALVRYRGLFFPARYALLGMALMQFNKVFDRNPRTVSLRNLLTAAKKDRKRLTPYATEEDLQHIEQRVDANESFLKKLKRYRDQHLAHHDAIIALTHHDAIIADDVSLPYGDMKQLVEEVTSMHNSLARGHDQSGTAFERIARDTERYTSEVVRIMCEERDRAIQRVEEIDGATSDGS